MKSLSFEQLTNVWKGVLSDSDARGALRRIGRDGFPMAHLSIQDPKFKHPCWADYIAALPFLPNRPSRRRLHSNKAFQKYRPLLKHLIRFAEQLEDPFCEKRVVTGRDISIGAQGTLAEDLRKAAKLIDAVLSWDWYTRERNPRNALIAQLRWMIRARTGSPHDFELATIIDAAFRAAGIKQGMYLEPMTLDRIEKREKESRVKATCRLNYLSGISPTPDMPKLAYSTSFARNRRNRV